MTWPPSNPQSRSRAPRSAAPTCTPSVTAKAAALGYSLAPNYAFVDGNKQVIHAAMETFLVLNGLELDATVDEQERVMLSLAAGSFSRGELLAWLDAHVVPTTSS